MAVVALEESYGLAETLWSANGFGRGWINGNRDNVTAGNEPLRFGLEDGELEREAGVADFSYPSMDMENFIKKSPVMILAECLHVIKINPCLQKFVVAVIDCF
jgi:hypothetical protein